MSIRASKLPYKRKALIKTGISYHFDGNSSSVYGYNVEITNVGNLPINISYLGFGWYKQGRVQKIFSFYESHECKGIIKTSELLSDCYSQTMFIDLYKTINEDVVIYGIAIDEIGNIYKRKFSKLSTMIKMK